MKSSYLQLKGLIGKSVTRALSDIGCLVTTQTVTNSHSGELCDCGHTIGFVFSCTHHWYYLFLYHLWNYCQRTVDALRTDVEDNQRVRIKSLEAQPRSWYSTGSTNSIFCVKTNVYAKIWLFGIFSEYTIQGIGQVIVNGIWHFHYFLEVRF